MAASATDATITDHLGDDIEITCTTKDADGNAYDLTGGVLTLDLTWNGRSEALTNAITVTDAAAGEYTLLMPHDHATAQVAEVRARVSIEANGRRDTIASLTVCRT